MKQIDAVKASTQNRRLELMDPSIPLMYNSIPTKQAMADWPVDYLPRKTYRWRKPCAYSYLS